MRSYVIGLVIAAGFTLAVLAIRPGGLRRQFALAARRFRIVLVLGGVYLLGSIVIRIAFTTGPVADYGPAVLATALGLIFVFVARDPAPRPEGSGGRSSTG